MTSNMQHHTNPPTGSNSPNRPDSEIPPTNERDAFHIISERSRDTIALTSEIIFGKRHLVLRKGHFIKGGTRFWSSLYFLIKPSEIPDLHRLLSQYLDLDELEPMDLVRDPRNECPPLSNGSIARMSLQDQVLLHLEASGDPDQVRRRVLGDSSDTRLRFTEIGKALRRLGYLHRRSWELTDEGRKQAQSIRGEYPGIECKEADDGKPGSTADRDPRLTLLSGAYATLNLF